jgi:hypothetical protein
MRNAKIFRAAAIIAAAAISIVLLTTGIQKIGSEDADDTTNLEENPQTVMVKMPDGIHLATTILFPPEGDGPWPTLLTRTPYGRNEHPEFVEFGEDLAREGIVIIVQDQRGRYDSEGEDNSFFSDKIDGPATIDWITAQSWSNGIVATEGGSALGIMQYLLAPGASEALTCQWIEVATPDLYKDVHMGGVYRHEMFNTWLEEIDSEHLIDPWQSQWLNDDYWDAAQIVDEYADVHVPAFHVGGYYDAFASGIVEGFLGYQYEGGEGAAGHQHLVLGPWIHATNEPSVGEMTYPEAILDELYDEWQLMWFEACILGSANMDELDQIPAVTYYTMGAVDEEDAPGNEWQTAETWPPEGTVEARVYLHPEGTLVDELPPEQSNGDTFRFNPGDPSPTICGRTISIDSGACDQGPIEEREDVLVYTSPILDTPVEVSGNLRAEIWFTTDAADTDIVVRLTDVYPDGRSMLVVDGTMRARFHNSPDFSSFELLEPGEAYLVSFDLGPTSIVFNAGHQIRVSVTSSNWPRFSVNPNTGEMYLTDGKDGQIAQTTILHDADHPSAIILPIK